MFAVAGSEFVWGEKKHMDKVQTMSDLPNGN